MRPSDTTLKIFEKLDKKKYLPTQEEMKQVKEVKIEEKEENRKKKIERIRKSINALGIQLKSRAKGPNPLSKKKKKDERSQSEKISSQKVHIKKQSLTDQKLPEARQINSSAKDQIKIRDNSV